MKAAQRPIRIICATSTIPSSYSTGAAREETPLPTPRAAVAPRPPLPPPSIPPPLPRLEQSRRVDVGGCDGGERGCRLVPLCGTVAHDGVELLGAGRGWEGGGRLVPGGWQKLGRGMKANNSKTWGAAGRQEENAG